MAYFMQVLGSIFAPKWTVVDESGSVVETKDLPADVKTGTVGSTCSVVLLWNEKDLFLFLYVVIRFLGSSSKVMHLFCSVLRRRHGVWGR